MGAGLVQAGAASVVSCTRAGIGDAHGPSAMAAEHYALEQGAAFTGGRAPPWVLLEASWRWLDRKLCRLMEPGCWSWLTTSQRPRDCSMLRERMKPSASVHRSAFTRPDTQAPT